MKLIEFNKIGERKEYISKERFWFENDKVSFWYRLYINTHEFQPDWNPNEWKTKYEVMFIVDKESLHERHKENYGKVYSFDSITYGFLLKQTEKKGKFSEDTLQKVLDSALKVNIENKIKVNKYQKIKGIVEGSIYYI